MALTSARALFVIAAILGVSVQANAQLSTTFYASKCPNATNKAFEVVKSWIVKDRSMAPALLRLHFHDCFVRGCDASVLLDSTVANSGEKDAGGNKNSLRGFEIIDDVKAKLEAMCPGIVSCADILALAARDSMLVFGGLNYTVPLGRRDGVSSFAWEANNNLPPPFADFNMLMSLFSAKGLTTKDMVVLSGAHTVGFSRCSTLQQRLYNFSSTNSTDPSIDPSFVPILKSKCKFGSTGIIMMDQSKATDTWDFNYFSNVLKGRVLFQSDDAIKRTAEGLKLVQAENKAGGPFTADFGASMLKMGNIQVLTGTSGQIRKNCRVVNK
ncbi:peroxidase [Marchantia polymorpha subsp. ruderalis]|uniref:Peroxidase n=2 Tax=Marchantia polymorpha TaxID=3197 RepID=A0A176WH24_MARPO|nr:hypothetical protein AXG93_3923s1000 [Marchantia polymorpha subsp. ruderalis]PTQ31569.1 hypothetical protein MARPO_0109s0004 [Marchantia polymorpha]BBN20783.1 hypothetical protein Mp_zg01380 [Marchantia polymorpha subsp. ruderalis]|eukprot:PTQ31569.1 hypothetical protein MARPO_0109s0004 [Marchantia polymorpha]